MGLVSAVVQGVLVGGLYALFAAGLSLIFGVMRVVNLAHGDLIVASAYLGWVVVHATGLHPLASLVVVLPIAASFGYLLQISVLNRTVGKDILPPLIVSFGLAIIIQNSLLQIFSADSRKLDAGLLETSSFDVFPGIAIGFFPLLVFVVAIAVIAGLQFVFYRTKLGRSFRATSDDAEIAQLMGFDNKAVFAQAMALCLVVVALAGVLLAIRFNFDPFIGPSRLIFGFEAIIIGGLGNMWGTLLGGIILGVAQGLGAEIDPGLQVFAGHLAFLIILALKPRGLFPRTAE